MHLNTSVNRRVLAGVAGVNLALALAVGAGAIPRPGAGGNGTTIAASAKIDELAAPAARQPGDVPPDTAAAPTTTAAPTTAPPTTAVKTTTPTTKAPVKTTATTKVPATTGAPAPAAAAAAPAAAPAAPAKVARRVPSAAEVSQAIATLPQYVSTIFTPTPAQVAQLGDQVCTAFDQGQTFAQVKATGLSMITQVPLTTVKPGGADWVVKTIVNLYCPGYASKLV
jgi:hypothetical protein